MCTKQRNSKRTLTSVEQASLAVICKISMRKLASIVYCQLPAGTQYISYEYIFNRTERTKMEDVLLKGHNMTSFIYFLSSFHSHFFFYFLCFARRQYKLALVFWMACVRLSLANKFCVFTFLSEKQLMYQHGHDTIVTSSDRGTDSLIINKHNCRPPWPAGGYFSIFEEQRDNCLLVSCIVLQFPT